MKPFYLVETITKDKLVHQGIFFHPSRKATGGKLSSKRALLWVHGLTSTFYGDTTLFGELTDACEKEGMGFAAFNNRGHDETSSFRKIDSTKTKGYDHVYIGAGREVFEECVYDIESGISFLEQQGFREVFLIGHSTGANKVCYYAATKKDKRVKGVVLAGPLSDRLDPGVEKKKISADRKKALELIKRGKGDELVFGFHFFPMTPKRHISLFGPSNEDMFDYGDTSPKLKFFSAIKIPTMVIIGGNDEYADRAVKDIVNVFDLRAKMKHYKSVIVPNGLHGFEGNEQGAAESIMKWVRFL